MLKRPDNRIILLTAMFLSGLAMIIIPLMQQKKEIDNDNNIYAMIAEEIRHQQATVSTNQPIQMDEEDTAAEDPMTILSKDDEIEDISVPEAEASPAPEMTEEATLPAMIVEESVPPEDAEQTESDDSTAQPTAIPVASVTHSPTKKPEANTTKPPATQNADYVAWISIPDTVIDYPVVRSDRSEYYLHHLITGQESKLGTLFSLKTSDYQTPSRNIAIYGHHLSNSTAMFSTLLEYKKESYWKTHPTIQLDTIYGSRTYRIFAVLNHTVSDWDASTASFASDRAFLKFVNRAKANAFYDTGITVSEDDHIITLITCDRSYGGVQGRLLVMGVEQ